MKGQRVLMMIIGLLALWLLATGALAAPAAQIYLNWQLIGGGGGAAASADYSLNGSLGQPVVEASGSADYRVGSGYWYGIGEVIPVPAKQKIFLPIILKLT